MAANYVVNTLMHMCDVRNSTDVQYIAFVDLDDIDKDEEYYFTNTPPANITLPLN